jgi:hypothetical protein
MFNNIFFSNIWANKLFSYNYVYNCCFYNFYNENNFLFFKITDTYKSLFNTIIIKFFKKRIKKVRKPLKKVPEIQNTETPNTETPNTETPNTETPNTETPKLEIVEFKKQKKFVFKFKRKRFKFKKLKKHFKSFFFNESLIKNEDEKLLDLNFFYFFNFLVKIKKLKKIKIKKKNLKNLNFYFFESFFLKKKFKNNLIARNSFYSLNLKKFNKINLFYNFYKFLFYFKNNNLSFLKKTFFLKSFKNVKNFNKNIYKHKHDNKSLLTIYKNIFLFTIYNSYNHLIYNVHMYYNITFIQFKFIYSLNTINKLLKVKKNKRFKRIKRKFTMKSNFLKSKKKYRYKYRYVFYNKLNARRNNLLFKKTVYKFILINLYNSFKLKSSFFNFNNLNKYNYYFYYFLKNQKSNIRSFFKKNLFFFDFIRKKNNNINAIYNNQYPVYNSNKLILKSFKKIFKSHFNKKLNNNLYFYIIPVFEFIFNKNVLIKSNNSNIFKNLKIKKKFFKKKLLKIYKKNKFSVLSRSVNYNLYEVIEIILYSFYYKDIYFLLNWFIKNFSKTHFTHHNNFLVLFHTIMNDIFESYRDIFQIKGFYYTLKGKVGVTSNAKKKAVRFKMGSSNKSKKSQKMDFQQGVVKSLSGSVGVSMILTY